MAHATSRGAYRQLTDRLNRFPQGAPPSELLYRILELLFSEREAGLVAQLPIRPFTAREAARTWGMGLTEARAVLDGLASRAILLDMEGPNGTVYILPPPMAGFFEFSMMRVRDDVDQKLLAELYYQYITVEDDFIVRLFTHGETQLGRVFVNERALAAAARPSPTPGANGDGRLRVLDYERASEVIGAADHLGVGVCYCRHKAEHVGRACTAPKNICMTFGGTADSLIRHGYARRVDRAEGRDLLAEAHDNNLVQFGENVQNGVAFICNCCGCCCEAMIAARRFGLLDPVHTTNFIPQVSDERCNGCGKCVNVCPVEAMTLVSANDPPSRRNARRPGHRPLPGLRRLRPRLPHGRHRAGGARGARADAGRHAPPDRSHGDRARPAAGLHLRQPGAPQPPGDGGGPRRHPAPAADEAGAGHAADALALPRPPAGARAAVGAPRGRPRPRGFGTPGGSVRAHVPADPRQDN